jgi:hypothetical protein
LEGTGDYVPFDLFSKLNTDTVDKLSTIQRVAILFLISFVIILINWLISTSTISNFYGDILPHNQTYTELAFDNVNNLPSSVSATNQVNFSFMIHNVEGKTIDYPYIITVQNGNNSQVLKQGTVSLASNAQVSIAEDLSIHNLSQRQEVIVSLPTKQQAIDLWLKGSES